MPGVFSCGYAKHTETMLDGPNWAVPSNHHTIIGNSCQKDASIPWSAVEVINVSFV